ncbi:MAG TPA: YggS family pyridoxal phosphate-dependent enzyme [Terriglobales bacterium]|nr:YggS family pyridoxal phosphate-dependent enzyme [Terriglobales bacterium]
MSVGENLKRIRERVARAADRAKRDPNSLRLMAVSKTMPAAHIVEAYDAGQRLYGENRVQEFADKYDALARLGNAEFHMIGHLQSNKANKATEIFHAVDSLDSVSLGERLNAAAVKLGKSLEVLVEVNVGGEAAKSGIAPDSAELERILSAAPSWPQLQIRGLMTVPPFTDDPEGARPYFRRLRELCERIAARKLPAIELDELSMGMSHDFEIAIEEGSTCVRIGTAIFGERSKRG